MIGCSSVHAEEFRARGFTVLKGAIPPSLVEDLRKVCDKAREIARAKNGPQAQRLQPISDYDVDIRPYRAYMDLAEIREAVAQIFSPRHFIANVHLGVLFEPADRSWCTRWHRDFRDNGMPKELWPQWESRLHDINLFNQVNAALYEDTSLWVVPGSHARLDTPEEAARFTERAMDPPKLDGLAEAARERACLDYCRSMPGALQVVLDAGDIALYRNSLWHIGCYVPYRRRATLHDAVSTPEYEAYWKETNRQIAEWKARKASVMASAS